MKQVTGKKVFRKILARSQSIPSAEYKALGAWLEHSSVVKEYAKKHDYIASVSVRKNAKDKRCVAYVTLTSRKGVDPPPMDRAFWNKLQIAFRDYDKQRVASGSESGESERSESESEDEQVETEVKPVETKTDSKSDELKRKLQALEGLLTAPKVQADAQMDGPEMSNDGESVDEELDALIGEVKVDQAQNEAEDSDQLDGEWEALFQKAMKEKDGKTNSDDGHDDLPPLETRYKIQRYLMCHRLPIAAGLTGLGLLTWSISTLRAS